MTALDGKGSRMFYVALQEDERQVVDQGKETPFAVALEGRYRNAAEAAGPLSAAVAVAVGYLNSLGIPGVRADEARGRLWVDREQSGLVFMRLMEQFRVQREEGLNLVHVG
jgi:hypothetical protein